MWTSKCGLKCGPRFGGRERKKQFGGPQNGAQIWHLILGCTLPLFFLARRREKNHMLCRMFVSRFLVLTTTCPGTVVTAPHTRTHQPLMQPAPQRNTTFLSKMTTAPHAHTHQASKCSRRHNETPRYDSKWPPRHMRTHARLQNAARTTTGHHVTIEHGHRATRKP